MSDSVIAIESLGKRYRYGGLAPLSHNLRQDLTDWAKGFLRRNHAHHATFFEVHEKHITDSDEYFWALKDLNLEIKQGDVVGIIGRNGAGKSTLLKILSRITPPTKGKIIYNGRVASLLEVGTGFHRELTGRENIFLNGSILGMKRSDIASKLDEIVAFAEVDKFVDTPVKFYSSGMYVRLAFAVAAHLESEILVVDEVLAVGDAGFQRKCLGKMEQLSKQGRTTLFVSHNMATIVQLCSLCAWINAGKLQQFGSTREIVDAYLRSSKQLGSALERTRSHKIVEITRVTCLDSIAHECSTVQMGGELVIVAECHFARQLNNISFGISIENVDKQRMFGVTTAQEGIRIPTAVGDCRVCFHLSRVTLGPGEYSVTVAALDDGRDVLDWWDAAATFEVVGADMSGSGYISAQTNGLVWLEHTWTVS